MATQSREKIRSFDEILEAYQDASMDLPITPKPAEPKVSPIFSVGADLGLGLLNELYFKLKRPSQDLRDTIRVRYTKNKISREEPRTQQTEAPIAAEPPKAEPVVIDMKLPPMNTEQKNALTFFESQGIKGLFSTKQVKKAFRLLAKRFHPDAKPNAPAKEKEKLSTLFRELKRHNEILVAYFEDFEAHSSGV